MKNKVLRTVLILVFIILTISLVNNPKKIDNEKDINLEKKELIKELIIPKHINIKVVQEEQEEKEVRTYYNIPLHHELQDYIRELCERYDVDMKTFLGIIATESSFRNNAKSKNNSEGGYSVGLCQLNENYNYWYAELTGLGEEFNIYNVQHNIWAGILVYKSYRDHWEKQGYKGETLDKLALLSYNRGIGGAKKCVSRHGYENSYIDKVRKHKNNLKEEIECVKVKTTED